MAGSSSVMRRWAEGWQRRWDELEQRHVPNRDLWIGALLDVIDAIGVESPTVLDVACGTGTVTRRLLQRRPSARSIAVDVDPVLLKIASAGPGRLYITKAAFGRSRFRNGSITSFVCRAASAFFSGVQKSTTPAGSGVFQPHSSSTAHG